MSKYAAYWGDSFENCEMLSNFILDFWNIVECLLPVIRLAAKKSSCIFILWTLGMT